jgi:hypothetical protein
MPQTLDEQLALLEQEMDTMKEQLIKSVTPAIVIAYTDKVMHPAFEMMLRAHHAQVPVAEIDEAIVSVMSSILFDYLQRIHPKEDRAGVLDHMNLIGQDITERLVAQVMKAFDDKTKLIIPNPTRH